MKLTEMIQALAENGVTDMDYNCHAMAPTERLPFAILCINDLDNNEHYWLSMDKEIESVNMAKVEIGNHGYPPEMVVLFEQGGVPYKIYEYNLIIIH